MKVTLEVTTAIKYIIYEKRERERKKRIKEKIYSKILLMENGDRVFPKIDEFRRWANRKKINK